MADLTSYAGLAGLFGAGDKAETTFDPMANVLKVTSALQAVDNLKARRAAMAQMEAMKAGEAESGQPANPYLRLIQTGMAFRQGGDMENAKRAFDAADGMIKDIAARDPQAAAALMSMAQGANIRANSPDLFEMKPDMQGQIQRIPKIDNMGAARPTGVTGEMELEKAAMAAEALAAQGLPVPPQLARMHQMWVSKGQTYTSVPQDAQLVPTNPRSGLGSPSLAGGTGRAPLAPPSAAGGFPLSAPGAAPSAPGAPPTLGGAMRPGVLQRDPRDMRVKDIDKTEEELKAYQDNIIPAIDAMKNFKPEYLTYMGKGKAALLDLESKLGVKLNAKDQEYIANNASFLRDTAKNFNRAANELGGKTLTANELKRMELQEAHSGDNEYEFLTKLQSNITGTYAMLFRRQLALDMRVNPNELVKAGFSAPDIQQGIKASVSKVADKLIKEGMSRQAALAQANTIVGGQYYQMLRQSAAEKMGRK